MSLTDLHRKLIELDRMKANIKKFFDDYKSTTEALVKEFGIGHSFQDEEGIVYQLAEQEGKYVSFDRYTVERTKRPGEERGTLSVKKAQEMGYTVK